MHFQGALKPNPLEPDDMFYRKQKLAGLSQNLSVLCYIFYFTLFIKDLRQKNWRTTVPINSAP